MIKFLDLSAQYQSIKTEIDQKIQSVIESSAFIGGKYVMQFEASFSNYVGASCCVGVGNGTDALEIAIEALDIPLGSEIIVPANSFIASSEAVTRSGHKVVFADVDSESYVLSIESVKNLITSKTKAIIAVHLYGHPCDMDELTKLAKKHGIYIIEDCAQAHGARYKDKPVGSIGDVAAWSFCQDKIMSTGGEGGMVTTNDKYLWRKMWEYKDHGKSYEATYEREHPEGFGFKWLYESFGTNFRMTEMQAVIGRIQIKRMNISV